MTLVTTCSPRFVCRSPQVRLLIFVCVTLFSCLVESQDVSINGTPEFELPRAYAFVLAQGMKLSYIATKYPELKESVELALGRFDAAFPDILAKLKAQLVQEVGPKMAETAVSNLPIQVRDLLTREKMTKPIARSYILEVHERSMRTIKSPILEYLLAAKYEHDPAREFADGFRQPYETTGLGNSRGIKLKFQLPQSWRGGDSDQPSTVQKWQSRNGRGPYVVALDVVDAAGTNPTQREIEEFVKSGEVKSTVPNDQNYVASGTFSGNKLAGYWVQTTLSNYRAGTKQYVDMLQHMFFVRGKGIVMTCLARGPDSEKFRVQSSFKLIRPLCQEVVNSVILL